MTFRRVGIRFYSNWMYFATLLALLASEGGLAAQSVMTSADGTTPPGMQGGAPLGSYSTSNLDTVNLYNGNLLFNLGLFQVTGRGDAEIPIPLKIERRWHVEQAQVQGTNLQQPSAFFWYHAAVPPYSPGLLVAREIGDNVNPFIDCSGQPVDTVPKKSKTVTRLTFIGGEGTEMEMRDQGTSGQPLAGQCTGTGPSRGNVFVSTDGSAATFVSDSTIFDTPLPYTAIDLQTYPSGILYFRNGTHYRIDNGYVSRITDRNGNAVRIFYDGQNRVNHIIDSLNRVVTFSYTDQNNLSPPRDQITYFGYNSASRMIQVFYGFISQNLFPGETPSNYNQLFPELNGSTTTPFDATVPTSVQLPDGRSYSFLYSRYGELKRVTLPTGGTMEYDYSDASGGAGSGVIGSGTATEILRRLKERRVLTDGTNLELRTTYTPTYSGSSAADFATTVTEVSTDGAANVLAKATHTFYGNASAGVSYYPPVFAYSSWKEGRESQTIRYNTDGVAVLRTINNTWAQRYTVGWWTDSVDLAPTGDPRIATSATTLDDGQVSKQTFGYDNFNNVTDVFDYHYNQSSPFRHRQTIYLTTNLSTDYTAPPLHIRNLPARETVSASNGVADTMASQTTYAYDQDPPASIPGNVVGLDPLFFILSQTRGNLSQVNRWLHGTSSDRFLSTHNVYDAVGNVVSSTDPKGNPSSFDYTDHFGVPGNDINSNSAPFEVSSGVTLAFRTRTTNALGQISKAQYDYHIGAAVQVQDPNGVIASTAYADPLERPTQTIQAANTSVKAQRNFTYLDSVRTLHETRDQLAFVDNRIAFDHLYDGLGRTTETRQFEDGGSYISLRKQFDGLSRVVIALNPYRASEPQLQTVYHFDGLGRPTSIDPPDHSTTNYSYFGNKATITDPAGSTTFSLTDALGRLVQVQEINSSGSPPIYSTNYSYDVLDNLTQVTQGAVLRFFDYDSLKRLTQATEPESGTTSFIYDDNGNATRKTDSRGIVTTLSFDAINRMTQKSYSDGTPTATNTFDDPTVPYSIGRLTAVASSASKTSYAVLDPVGRVLSSQQLTGGTTYQMSYTYDLAGELSTESYPSGRVVTNSYDSAGRLTGVAGQVSVGSPSTAYASGGQYASHGEILSLGLGNGLFRKASFNNRLQPTQINLGTASNPASAVGFGYAFSASGADNNGNVRSHSITLPGIAQPVVQTFTYDGLNRLVGATESLGGSQSWLQNFAYDAPGNRAVLPGSLIPSPGLTPQSLAAFDGNNRIVGFNYDASGNLIGDGFNTMSYDAENRQTAAVVPVFGGLNYTYDGNGQRVKQVANGATTVYVRDAFQRVVAEYMTQAPATSTSYIFADHLGSVRVITDSSGAVKSRHDYFPFGEELAAAYSGRSGVTGYSATESIRERFTGKERDSESGFDYFLARYYSSAQGRFQSADRPSNAGVHLQCPQSWNSYTYGLNNPLRFVDPNGEASVGAWFEQTLSRINSWTGIGSAVDNSAAYNWLNYHPYAPAAVGITPLAIYGAVVTTPELAATSIASKVTISAIAGGIGGTVSQAISDSFRDRLSGGTQYAISAGSGAFIAAGGAFNWAAAGLAAMTSSPVEDMLNHEQISASKALFEGLTSALTSIGVENIFPREVSGSYPRIAFSRSFLLGPRAIRTYLEEGIGDVVDFFKSNLKPSR